MKFLNFTKQKFKTGEIYAVHKGIYLGHLLVYINFCKTNNHHCFLSIKGLKNINVPEKDIEEGLKTNLLRKTNIELPKEFRTLCIKQYNYNIENSAKQVNIEVDENVNFRQQ